MVYIQGVNFEAQRLVKASLEKFYGVGPYLSQRLMARYHIHPTALVGSLREKQINQISAELSNMTIDNDLKRKIRDNIRRLREMGSYRGRRHLFNLPVRGQRTRTQISTARKLNRIERKA